jgi:hypothetical protein
MIYSEGLEVQPAPEGLERFVNAQKDVIEEALAELRAGWKRTHWMWFVLPQMRGLGMSNMSQRFGIASLDEARAYLAHDALGPRLLESMEILDRLEGRPVGHFKLPHLWSPKLPQAGRVDYQLAAGFCASRAAASLRR